MSSSERPGRSARSSNEQQRQPSSKEQPQLPPQLLQQADDAAAAAATSDGVHEQSDLEVEPPIEEVPPPPYSANQYGEIDITEKGMDTGARVAEDGRVDIKISSKNRRLTSLLKHQLEVPPREPSPEPEIPAGLGYTSGLPPPPMNIVIQIVGSRGDVQPFIALGLVLKEKFNHRVRIATHPVFKDFVTENGLEFFSIGGDPAELMAFMVKNPGLMPGMEAIRSGDIGKKRKGIYEMINGCWRSCIEPGDGTGAPATDDTVDHDSIDSGVSVSDPAAKPFVADAIIANPPSFAHIHIAEKLGVPLHLMFTMPWSPTQSFPHPLANIISSNADAGMTNFLSYILVDLLTWQGIGDVINRFREKTLKLEPMSIIWAPGNLHRLRIPWTYCWSPALIPKPSDWSKTIDISGFYFLNLATNYTPPPDLAEFLDAGEPPVYIGFGSIVVDDPNAMTRLIFEAVKKTGRRALVSKGWGGFSADEMGVPEGVFMLGNCPHDWLFKKVSCVVHHGGAGTTAAGIAAGRPTIIVPFFGDQPFWGQMCHRAGAGPEPIPHKKLTADNLAEAINFALQPEVLDRAKEMRRKIQQEQGTDSGAESFHRHLKLSKMRCTICPGRVAVWQYRKTDIRLSALAATVLANEGLLEFSDLRLHRACEYLAETGPPEPISGGAAALIGSLSAVGAGVADYPSEVFKAFKKSSKKSGENGSPERSGVGASSSTLDVINQQDAPSAAGNLSPRDSISEISATPSKASIVITDADTTSTTKSTSPSRQNTIESSIGSPSRSTASLHPDESPRHSRASRSNSQDGSGASTPRRQDCSPSLGNAGQITMDSLMGSAKATGNIVAAGMKSPLDFTMGIAQGFRNAPKLYGDKTVRPAERVTGFHSGLKAAGKEFGYGFYDGISGLITQPLKGAKEEGFAGLGKGIIKGSFGLILKPGAAIWGLPGYTMKGVYAEIVKNFGKSTSNFIIASRTAQGYEEWKASSEGDRERIVSTWKSDVMQSKMKGGHKWKAPKKKKSSVTGKDARFYGEDGKLLKGFGATKHLSYDDRKRLHQLREDAAKGKSRSQEQASDDIPQFQSPTRINSATDEEFEQAIRTAVQRTSTNDPEEDARIERAIRASVKEFQRKMSNDTSRRGHSDDDDEAYDRAVAASVAEYQRQPQRSDSHTIEMTLNDQNDDEEFTRALAASLEESRRAPPRQSTRDEGLGSDTEDDEEYRKAIEESNRAYATSRAQPNPRPQATSKVQMAPRAPVSPRVPTTSRGPPQPPNYDHVKLSPAPPIPARSSARQSTHSPSPRPAQSQPRPSSSTTLPWQQGITDHKPPIPDTHDDDSEYSKAIQASEQEAKQRELDLAKQQNEEDIVLEYVKKQSLKEEEYRRKRMEGQ